MQQFHNGVEWLEQIYHDIEQRPLFAKYDQKFGTPILHKLNFKKVLHKFSWGMLYAQIHKLSDPHAQSPSVQVAADLELIAFASRILDDLVDEDDPHIEGQLGRANTLLLMTELLVDSLSRLQRYDSERNEQIRACLMDALHGEWMDVNYTALDELTEVDYIQRILPKSSGVFKLAAVCASTEHRDFWDEFLTYASLARQLSNDMAGIYTDAKSDLHKLHPTLPLLKALDVEDDLTRLKRSHAMMAYTLGSGTLEASRLAVEESGALEYCYLIRELYKEKCREMLSAQFADRLFETKELFTLLELEAV